MLLDDGQGNRWLMSACELHAGIRYMTEKITAALGEPLGLKIEDV